MSQDEHERLERLGDAIEPQPGVSLSPRRLKRLVLQVSFLELWALSLMKRGSVRPFDSYKHIYDRIDAIEEGKLTLPFVKFGIYLPN